MSNKVYFGHPVSLFGTEKEEELIGEIEEKFDELEEDYKIVNPANEKHQQNYEEWMEKEDETGMDYYFEEVLPEVDAGVFLPFEDGKYGAGCVGKAEGDTGEAEFIASQGNPIYKIDYEGNISEMNLDEVEALTVEETNERLPEDME